MLLTAFTLSLLPADTLGDWLRKLFGDRTVYASATLGEPQVHAQAPECSFRDELYDGTQKISRLSSLVRYKTAAPGRVSLKDFFADCGSGRSFDRTRAEQYKTDGCKLMICDAEDLYRLSAITNLCDGAVAAEQAFYLILFSD